MKILFQRGHPQLNTGRTHFKKGIIPWNKGEKGLSKHTEEWKKMMSEKRKGIKLSEEIKEKLRRNHNSKSNLNLIYRYQKGIIPWNKGKKMSYPNMGRKKGSISWNKGKKLPQFSGENHWAWKKDRTKIKGYWLERNNPEYKQWVKKVKKRDNNSCRLKDNNCFGYNIVHHIKDWSEYPELRYKVLNGITLCRAHHPRTRAEEKRLIPIFEGLVSVSSE